MHGEKMATCTVMEHANSVLHPRATLETFLETANRTTNSERRHSFYDNRCLKLTNQGDLLFSQAMWLRNSLKKSRNPSFMGKSFQQSPTEKSGGFWRQLLTRSCSSSFNQLFTTGFKVCQESFNANFCGTKIIHFKALGLQKIFFQGFVFGSDFPNPIPLTGKE